MEEIDGTGYKDQEEGDPFIRFAFAEEPDPETITRVPSRWRMWFSALGLGWLLGREMAERK